MIASGNLSKGLWSGTVELETVVAMGCLKTDTFPRQSR
jgi:hypothetical protein